MYKDVANNIENFTLQTPITIVPSPSDKDYNLGFIYRYFIQKANDENSFIYEISEKNYETYKTNAFWKKYRMKWRISGPTQSIYKDGELSDRGVMASNKSSISIASSELKNISLYLPNPLQFHKG